MPLDRDIRLLQSELGSLRSHVSKMIDDEKSRYYLRFDERHRVQEILGAIEEDLVILEKGAEVISTILAGIEN